MRIIKKADEHEKRYVWQLDLWIPLVVPESRDMGKLGAATRLNGNRDMPVCRLIGFLPRSLYAVPWFAH